MPKISDRPLTRLCVRLWSDDCEYLQQKSRDNPEIPFNFLVRNIVTTFVRQMRAMENRLIDEADTTRQLSEEDFKLLNEPLETEDKELV